MSEQDENRIENKVKTEIETVMIRNARSTLLSPIEERMQEAAIKTCIDECEYWQSKLKERDELLAEMAEYIQPEGERNTAWSILKGRIENKILSLNETIKTIEEDGAGRGSPDWSEASYALGEVKSIMESVKHIEEDFWPNLKSFIPTISGEPKPKKP